MTSIARSNRCHIAVFGRRNAGKSSLVNALVGQAVSIVSDVAGTTTDTVWKNIELPGVGAAVIADTAGFDDEGVLGAMRVDAARKVLARADVAILLIDATSGDVSLEKEWYEQMQRLQLPVVVVAGKCDADDSAERIDLFKKTFDTEILCFSAVTGEGYDGLLARLVQCYKRNDDADDVTHSLVEPGDFVVLVMPQDASAPKGRLIMPQVQVMPSASLNFSAISLTISFIAQRPSFPQAPQATHPRISSPPTVTVSVSISFSIKIFSISESASAVFPLLCGLPFKMSTFIY